MPLAHAAYVESVSFLPHYYRALRDRCQGLDVIGQSRSHILLNPPEFPTGGMEGSPMGTPEERHDERKSTPEKDQPNPSKSPEQHQKPVDGGDEALNLARRGEGLQGWKSGR